MESDYLNLEGITVQLVREVNIEWHRIYKFSLGDFV